MQNHQPQREIKIRGEFADYLSKNPWQWYITSRISANLPFEAIDRRAHDFLHAIQRSTGIKVVGIGLIIKENAQSHVHILSSAYSRKESLFNIGAKEQVKLEKLWQNGARSALDDCVIDPIFTPDDRKRICSYISSKRNFIIDNDVSTKKSEFVFFGLERLNRFMKRSKKQDSPGE